MDRTLFDAICELVRGWQGTRGGLLQAVRIMGARGGMFRLELGSVCVRYWVTMTTVSLGEDASWNHEWFEYATNDTPIPGAVRVGDVLEHPEWLFYFRRSNDE